MLIFFGNTLFLQIWTWILKDLLWQREIKLPVNITDLVGKNKFEIIWSTTTLYKCFLCFLLLIFLAKECNHARAKYQLSGCTLYYVKIRAKIFWYHTCEVKNEDGRSIPRLARQRAELKQGHLEIWTEHCKLLMVWISLQRSNTCKLKFIWKVHTTPYL